MSKKHITQHRRDAINRVSTINHITPNQPDNKSLVVNQIVIRPITRQASDIDTWRNALRSADMGRVKQLFDLYEDLLIDGVLADAVEKRILAVTNSELTFQDANGIKVDEIATLIDSPAWEELLTGIMQFRFWGRAGLEFDFATGFNVIPIPPKHIRPEIRHILLNEYDDTGISYEGDDHIIVLHKKRDLGLFLKTAPYAIYKRGAFGDYAQWLEIFGMPQRVGKYSSYDPESRKLLETAMSQAGSAPWLVIPKESEVETIAAGSQGAGQSPYNEFRKACNEELLITILGQTMTTVQGDKGARSLGEVHKEVEEGKNLSDMRFVQRVLNHFVLPLLGKRGYPVNGGSFIFPAAAKSLTVAEIVQLSTIIEIPSAHLHEKYSIPTPVEGQPIAGRDAINRVSIPTEPPPAVTPPQPVTPPPDPVKKPIKNTDNIFKRFLNFFVNAPAAMTGAFQNLSLADPSESLSGRPSWSPSLINVQTLFNRAVKDIYKYKGRDGINPVSTINPVSINENLFAITNIPLQNAIDSVFLKVGADWCSQNSSFINQFKENTAVFSAFKNHQQTNEIVAKLYREDGSIRSFSEFKKEALKISEGYNKNYLQTEYNTAIRAARMAVNWKKFQETKKLYPNLEYMPSRAANPRESHKDYWNKVWAIDDPIWNIIMPPSDWNCFCGVRATDSPVTLLPADWNPTPVDPVFRNNPGVSASIVNVEATDFYKNTTEAARPLIILFAQLITRRELALKSEQVFLDKYIGKSGGFVNIVKQNTNEAEKNLLTYKTLADNGYQYTLLAPVNNGKNPDALNIITNRTSDAKHPVTENGKNAIQSAVKEASNQKAGEVVISLSKPYSVRSVYNGIKAAFQEGRAKSIRDVIIIKHDGSVKKLNATDIRDYFKKTKDSK